MPAVFRLAKKNEMRITIDRKTLGLVLVVPTSRGGGEAPTPRQR